jgi:predicted dehydrogenase
MNQFMKYCLGWRATEYHRIERYMNYDLNLAHLPPPPLRTDYRIGIVGAGFIVREIQLVAYRNAGFHVVGIASRSPEVAQEVAASKGIPRAFESISQLLQDPSIEVLDIAVPPDQQLKIVAEAAGQASHIRGILCQKPLATNLADAREVVRLCENAGIKLAVNQNMRFDQSIRALKTLLRRGDLGEPVLATIEMRAVPHWQDWLAGYERLSLLNMSIHHLDCFRFLFGNPDGIFVSARKDPRSGPGQRDGICLYNLEFANGMLASAWDDVWAGPNSVIKDHFIHWRVEGTEGVAHGTVGWPSYPNIQPSTIDFTLKRQPGYVFSPRWKEVWFPDAFEGTMGQLLDSLARDSEPEISGRDNLHTMALVEAGYQSLQERRLVRVAEFMPPDPAASPALTGTSLTGTRS